MRAVLAANTTGGTVHSWELTAFGDDATYTSVPEVAATTEGEHHNVFIAVLGGHARGHPAHARHPPRRRKRLHRDRRRAEHRLPVRASRARGGRRLRIRLLRRVRGRPDADQALQPLGFVAPRTRELCDEAGARRRTSWLPHPSGQLCVASTVCLPTAYRTRILSYGSVVPTSSLSGTKVSVLLGDDTDQSIPDVAWTGDAFAVAWTDFATGYFGGQDYICSGRRSTVGDLDDEKRVYALTPRTNGSLGFRPERAGGR